MQQFEKVYQNLSVIYSDKEPLINMITCYGLDKISHFGGDEIEVWNCIIFLRSKHRPDCYYTPNEKGLVSSSSFPAAWKCMWSGAEAPHSGPLLSI